MIFQKISLITFVFAVGIVSSDAVSEDKIKIEKSVKVEVKESTSKTPRLTAVQKEKLIQLKNEKSASAEDRSKRRERVLSDLKIEKAMNDNREAKKRSPVPDDSTSQEKNPKNSD